MHPRSNIKAEGHTFLHSNRIKKLTALAGIESGPGMQMTFFGGLGIGILKAGPDPNG